MSGKMVVMLSYDCESREAGVEIINNVSSLPSDTIYGVAYVDEKDASEAMDLICKCCSIALYKEKG